MAYRTYQGANSTPIWFLIAINLLVFIATLINPRLIRTFLGLVPDNFSSMPWTIVTNLFVHAGFAHIIFNMLTLFFLGGFLSRLIGWRRFLAVYFVGGILGNVFYLLYVYFLGETPGDIFYVFRTFPDVPVVGASGAVFALGGMLTAIAPKLKVLVFPIPVPLPLWVAVIGGFIILIFFPQVAWQAHLGGLVVGLIVGFSFRKRQRYSAYY